MKFKSGVLLGFGAGYVLGAKAGKERYQQIVGETPQAELEAELFRAEEPSDDDAEID